MLMERPFLAPRDVAKRLNLSTSRVQQLDREGLLPALRDSAGRRLYDPEAVERYAVERERGREARASNGKQKITESSTVVVVTSPEM
jgi:predicted site-specific integrase-resolvase